MRAATCNKGGVGGVRQGRAGYEEQTKLGASRSLAASHVENASASACVVRGAMERDTRQGEVRRWRIDGRRRAEGRGRGGVGELGGAKAAFVCVCELAPMGQRSGSGVGLPSRATVGAAMGPSMALQRAPCEPAATCACVAT